MPCLCGDTACPSCGPAQGVDPVREQVAEFLSEAVFNDLPQSVSYEWFVDYVADHLCNVSPDIAATLEVEAAKWARAFKGKRL